MSSLLELVDVVVFPLLEVVLPDLLVDVELLPEPLPEPEPEEFLGELTVRVLETDTPFTVAVIVIFFAFFYDPMVSLPLLLSIVVSLAFCPLTVQTTSVVNVASLYLRT